MGDRWQEQPDPRVAYYGPPGDDRARAANQNVPPRQSKEHKDGSVAMQQYRNPQAPPAKGQAQRAPRDLEAPSERDRDRPRRPKDSDCREVGQRPPDRGQRYDGPRDAPPRDDAPRDGPNRDDRPVKATQKMTQAPPDDDELVIITEMVPNKRRKTDESAGGRRTLPGGDVDRPPRPHSNPTAGFMPRDMQEGMKGRRDDSYDGAKGRQGYRDQRQRDPSRRMEDPRAQSDGRSGEQGHGRQRGPDPDLPAPKGSPSRAVPSYAGGFERARNYGDNASPPRAGHAMPRGSPARAPASKPVQQSLAPIFPPSAAQQAPAKNVSPPIPEPAAPAAPSTLEHVEEPAGNPAPKQPRKKQLAEVPVGQESFVTAKQQLLNDKGNMQRKLSYEPHPDNPPEPPSEPPRQQGRKFRPPLMDQDAGGGRAPSKLPNLVVAASKHQQPAAPVDERLRHLEPRMIEAIESEMVGPGDNTITWDDIAGLEHAKQSINEAIILPMLRPDIFNGLRAPPKGVLLYGPPGTGKTLLAKCIARQCRTSFFSISSSSLTSKWIGDGEKMVKCLFAVARVRQPAVIFVDELDSLLSSRTEGENDSARRMKTEFLIQFDGCATSESDRVLVIGATNRPGELDDAARRRFRKKLYIPLPNKEARKRLLKNLLLKVPNNLTEQEIDTVCDRTEGYSGSDLDQTVREAALGPIRNMAFEEIEKMAVDQLRPVSMADFDAALTQIKASVSPKDLAGYEEFEKMFGSSRS